MKSLSSSLLTEKASLQTASCYAVYIGTGTPTRLCNWDVAVTYDSNTYTGGVPIDKPTIRDGLTGTVKIGNVDDTFTSLVLNGTLKKKDITIYEIYFDDNNAVVDAETLFSGSIDGQIIDVQWCTLTLVPANDGAVVLCPRRRLVPSCGLVFKGTECGYSGTETTCSKTYDGCRNSGAPFGGFRFVPKPGTVFAWGGVTITVE